ncbi:MAG: glycosyltransferase family 39 protein [Lachnospiraceae bacterium]|nr:glycosyltransferase family 39 protein [Lachnospiraceae bacterium]
MFQLFAVTGLVLTLLFAAVPYFKGQKQAEAESGTAPEMESTESVKIMFRLGQWITRYYLVILLLIFAVFLFTRIFKLDSFPNGFHVDELSMAVDAKSIRDNGTDRSGIRYPVYFQNYGGGQNALYTYVEAVLLNFLPSTIFSFRIQAVFWGALCFFAMFGICYEITGSYGWALLGPLLVTTMPVYLMSERWGLEAYLFLPFSSFVMYFAIRAVKYERDRDWIMTGLVMGFSLYTYAVSYIVFPIFLLLTGIYLIRVRKLSVKRVLLLGIPLGLLAFPLVLFQLVNFKIIPGFSTLISDFFPLPIPREQEVSLSNICINLSFFRELFLGGEELTYNSFKEFGTIYLFLLPFVLAGFVICIKDLVRSLRERSFTVSALLLFYWFGATVFMLLVTKPNVNRVNELFMPFLLFIAIAVYRLFASRPFYLIWLFLWNSASFAFFLYFYFFLQNAVYGYHPLYTSASPGKAILKSEEQYLTDENTHIYIQFADGAISSYQQTYYFAGEKGEVYSDEEPSYGRATAKLPDELNVEENAVYIIHDDWPHIVSYLISEGFEADQTLPEYSILYRRKE